MSGVIPAPPWPESATFFTVTTRPGDDGGLCEVFIPTELSRGPWDPNACHGGPPTAILARASERLVPEQRLARIIVELGRPVPMAGFTIVAEVVRSGRTTSTTQMTLLDLAGEVRAQAHGLHISERAVLDQPRGDSFVPLRVSDSEPGDFPVRRNLHGLTGFRSATQVRYPIGEDCELGPTAVWMRTVAQLLPGETMSPFQRICPLADCGNAFSREGEPWEIGFVNADLTVALHRDPVGEWMGMASTAVWQPSGIGLTSSVLFDETGSVGRAMQTLVLQPVQR